MKRRNPLVVSLLTFITVGIYGLYWLNVTRSEMIQKKAKIPPFWPLLLPLLLVLAAVIDTVMPHGDSRTYNLIGLTNGALVLIGLATLFGIPYWLYFIYKYCGGVQKVTRKKLTQMSCFLLFILLMLISSATGSSHNAVTWVGGLISCLWFGFIQNAFNNKVPASKNT